MKNDKIGAEEIYLAPPTEVLEEAKEIGIKTAGEEKFPFVIQYDENQKNFLLTVLDRATILVESNDEKTHLIEVSMNMTQLSFMKKLDCVERVKTDEGINVQLAGETDEGISVQPTDETDEGINVQLGATEETKAVEETVDNTVGKSKATQAKTSAANVLTANEDNGVAVTCVGGGTSSCDCPTNVDMASAQEIVEERYISGRICCPRAEQWFKFIPQESKKYTIRSTGSMDTIGYLYDCCGGLITSNDDFAGKLNFRIVEYLTAGMTYYIRVHACGDQTGNYTLEATATIYPNSVNINKTQITLEKGVLYELPITPNYTYKGYNGAQRIPGLTVSISPSNSNEQKVWWWEQFGNVLECLYGWDDDGDRYIHVRACETGISKLYAEDWNENGRRDECTVCVDSMLIYRTRNRERLGFYDSSDNNDTTPIIAEDLTYGKKDTNTIISNGTRIALSDLNGYNSIQQRAAIIKNFFNSQINYDRTFMQILSEMVDHFVDGTGTDYSNEALTAAVQSHRRTQSYVNAVTTLIKEYIAINRGSINNLSYDESLWTQPLARARHPLVNAMNAAINNGADELYLPYYGYNNGVPGLTLAIDGFYGNKIKIKSFQDHGGSYSATIEFTFYDHFGLDTPDLTNIKFGNLTAGTLPGFKQWYILQHWSELEGNIQPRPFVTNVSFSVSIAGSY